MSENETPLGEVKITERGFQYVKFRDMHDVLCSIQQSSLAKNETPGTSAIWLGIEDHRMHLDTKLVRCLITVLEQWLANGTFLDDTPF